MFRIGAVNLDTSHPIAFADYLRSKGRARYAAAYNDGFRTDDEVAAFAEHFGLERQCVSLEELAECCDIGFLHSCDWDRHLPHALPLLERGVPVFIDKPLVGKAADCLRLEQLAGGGATILGCSSMRYAREVVEFVGRSAAERGEVLHAHGTVGTDEFNYACHIVEALGGLMGPGFLSSTFVGSAERGGLTCESYSLRHVSGATASYVVCHGLWQPCDLSVVTTKGAHAFRIDTGMLYAALLDRICDFLETGESTLATVPELTESVRVLLAGRISREQGGGEVLLSEIPADDPGFDGPEFERGYAAASRDIRCFWGESA